MLFRSSRRRGEEASNEQSDAAYILAGQEPHDAQLRVRLSEASPRRRCPKNLVVARCGCGQSSSRISSAAQSATGSTWDHGPIARGIVQARPTMRSSGRPECRPLPPRMLAAGESERALAKVHGNEGLKQLRHKAGRPVPSVPRVLAGSGRNAKDNIGNQRNSKGFGVRLDVVDVALLKLEVAFLVLVGAGGSASQLPVARVHRGGSKNAPLRRQRCPSR
mgnify:CR=1 FL=1